MNKFSEIIKELREKQGITQEQLAEYLDVSRGTVGMWETGKRRPSQELYEKIAEMQYKIISDVFLTFVLDGSKNTRVSPGY